MIDTVLIDIDNTLLDFTKCATDSIKKACEETGISYTDDIPKAFFPINDSLWFMYEKREIERQYIYDTRWDKIFHHLGIFFDGTEFEKHFFSHLSISSEKVDYAKEILGYLSGKYKVCAASNSTLKQQITRLTNAGLIRYFDDLFVSENIGFSKPQKEFFDECIKRLGKKNADECIMIGDSISSDIQGGYTSGMKTIWFDRKKGMTPKGIIPTYTVYSLKEIEKIL